VLLMEFIDSSALSTALPTLARAFAADPVHLKLALTSYILSLAIFTPISGWLSERFAARRVIVAAMIVFLIGSACCGLSSTLSQLVASRILQGVGGAMMTPVARQIVVGSTPKEKLMSIMGWFTMPALVGPLVGPIFAGLVLKWASWPWIFFLNLPVGVVGLIAILRWVPNLHAANPGSFDWKGFGLSATAITGLVVTAETAGLGLIPVWVLAGLLGTGFVAALMYFQHSRKVAKPIIDLTLVRYPSYRSSLTGGTLVRLGIGAGPFLSPLLLQVGLGWSPIRAGSITLMGGIGVLMARPITQRLIRRYGFRTMLITFVAATGVLSALPGLFRASTPVPLIMGLLLLTGFSRSSQFIAANTIAYADVPQDKVPAASTLAAVSQQVGLALGVSFGGLMLHWARSGGHSALTPDRFVLPYAMVGLTTLLALPVYLALDRNAGSEISGRRQTIS